MGPAKLGLRLGHRTGKQVEELTKVAAGIALRSPCSRRQSLRRGGDLDNSTPFTSFQPSILSALSRKSVCATAHK